MFAQAFSNLHLYNLYKKLEEGINVSDFSLLELMHHYTSGMKSVYTQEVYEGMLTIR